jgi:thiol-disulfide isomerase/thioredoxin
MIKLKGGDDKNSIMASAAKRMGLPMANAKGAKSAAPNYTSPGSHHAQQMSSSSSSASAIPDGPTPLAERLGMPSAVAASMQKGKQSKDWSSSSNRINMGAPVYIKGKSYRDDEDEEADITDDKPKRKLGDALTLSDDEDEDDDFLGGGDEEGRLLAAMREKRLAELKATTGKQQQWLGMGHGVYTDVVQDEFLKAVTASKYVICHFYHTSFESCKTLDAHLAQLARTHLPTRFIKINAEKAPFFTAKLQIKMLPTLVLFKDGIAIDRVVGLDELGGTLEFETGVLEKRLAKGGVILAKGGGDEAEAKRQDGVKGSIRSGGRGAGSDSDED